MITKTDSTQWADLTQANANITMIQEKFYAGWLQIARVLACKSSLVALEPINEPPASSAADVANLMKLNDLFLKALRDSGGFNAKRVVTLSGPGMDLTKSPLFVRPVNISNPWAFQFHYYSPCKLSGILKPACCECEPQLISLLRRLRFRSLVGSQIDSRPDEV